VIAQMPLQIPSLHEATLSVTDSLPSAGAPARKLLVGSKQNVERVDDVRPSLLPRFALADRTGHLCYLRGQPAVARVLVADRQVKGIAYGLRVAQDLSLTAIVGPSWSREDHSIDRERLAWT
jgi:hypothetical protein